MAKKPMTLVNPKNPKAEKVVAVFRNASNGGDGHSTSRTVWYATPEQLRELMDRMIAAESASD